jgi:hypothetical protein
VVRRAWQWLAVKIFISALAVLNFAHSERGIRPLGNELAGRQI